MHRGRSYSQVLSRILFPDCTPNAWPPVKAYITSAFGSAPVPSGAVWNAEVNRVHRGDSTCTYGPVADEGGLGLILTFAVGPKVDHPGLLYTYSVSGTVTAASEFWNGEILTSRFNPIVPIFFFDGTILRVGHYDYHGVPHA